MNTLTLDQIVSSHKTHMDTLAGLSQTAFDSVEKLVALNLQAARAALGESVEVAKAGLSAKDPQDLIALQQSLVQPGSEKALAYARQVYEIAASAQADFTRVAEAQMAEAQKSVLSVVDTALKNAPAGSESAVAIVKSAMQATQNAVDSVQKAARQATEVAEANFQAFTKTAAKANQSQARGKRA